MEFDSQEKTYNLHVKRFFTTWWVSSLVENQLEGEAKPYVCVVNSSLLLKWLLEKIKLVEHENFKKVMLVIESVNDVYRMVALTMEMKRIIHIDSSDSELKTRILEQEYLSSQEPYWPNRWCIDIRLHKVKDISKVIQHIWSLQNVERLSIRDDEDDKLESLPPQIGYYKRLKVLDLECNHLSSLPCTLQMCQQLKDIRLCGNNFSQMPIFLLNLPRLNNLTRLHNSFDFSNTSDCISKQTVQNPVESETNEIPRLCCDKLSSYAARALISYSRFKTIPDLELCNLPRHLRKDLLGMIYSFCGACKKGIVEGNGFTYTSVLDMFIGCTFVPVMGNACSYECAEQCLLKIHKLNEGYSSMEDAHLHVLVPDGTRKCYCRRCGTSTRLSSLRRRLSCVL